MTKIGDWYEMIILIFRSDDCMMAKVELTKRFN